MNIKKSLFGKYPLARAMGIYSIAIGVAELVKPGLLAKGIGLKETMEHKNVLRLRGLRELVSGVGIVAQNKPSAFLWSRVAGDALDFALIGKAMTTRKNDKTRLGIAAALFAGVAIADLLLSMKVSKSGSQSGGQNEGDSEGQSHGQSQLFRRSIKISKSPEELYALWRKPETLPKLMEGFAEFEYIDTQRGHWKIPSKIGPALEWEAHIVTEHEGMYLRWESVEGTTLPTYGWVRFRPVSNKPGKTEVILSMCFDPPGGALGDAALQLVHAVPDALIKRMLKQFKQLATGEATQQTESIQQGESTQTNLKISSRPGGGAGAF